MQGADADACTGYRQLDEESCVKSSWIVVTKESNTICEEKPHVLVVLYGTGLNRDRQLLLMEAEQQLLCMQTAKLYEARMHHRYP